LKHNGLKREF